MLIPAMLVALVFRYIFAFRLFSEVWLLTQGGPARLTEVLAVYLYKQSFTYNQFGLASAAGWVMVVLSGLIAALYMRLIYRNMFASEAAAVDARLLRLLGVIAVLLWSGFPILFIVLSSLKPSRDIFVYPPVWLFEPTFQHYVELWQKWPVFFGYLHNSLIIAELRHAARGRRQHARGLRLLALPQPAADRVGLLPDRGAPAAADRDHAAAVPDGRLSA